MHYKRLLTMGLLCTTLMITGCGNDTAVQIEDSNAQEEVVLLEEEGESVSVETQEPEEPVIVEEPEEELDLQVVKPNEVGQIMVIMYHTLGTKKDPYIRTVEDFREDLEILYEKGYRLISMEDYTTNHIEVEAGCTPVVLTFDDGHVTNFNILDEATKEIDPECSLGILESFYQEHPDFGLRGVFYLNGGYPFKQKDLVSYKLNYLLDHGLEIGNHSYGHENFKKTSRAKIEETLGKNLKAILEIVPNAEVKSLALPFGSRPAAESNYDVLVHGSYDGVSYEHTSILNVGWKPEYASIHAKFNPESINRVRAGNDEFELRYWIQYFDDHPSKRFISDGDADIVTVLESDVENINQERLGDMEIRTYNLEE